jgi:multidrug efflux pump subunit AcrA (membrane-fusion protein)
MTQRIIIRIAFLVLPLLSMACGSGDTDSDSPAATRTPVTVTQVTIGPLEETVDVNAVSAFLLKSAVKATTTGYLLEVHASLGQYVEQGQILFRIKTKEARSLESSSGDMDSVVRFRGIVSITAPGSGYITQLNYRAGDYVQDGEALTVIGDKKTLGFLLEIPFELTPLLALNRTVTLQLPDGRTLVGTVGSSFPVVDAVSQTQSFRVTVANSGPIPEGLIARVRLVKQSKPRAVSVPKAAVLTDEVQRAWWIMKLINDSTAVRVDITKGLEIRDRVEVLSPVLEPTDAILLTGNYGLPDTACVIVRK